MPVHTRFRVRWGDGYWVQENACSDRSFLHLLSLPPPAFMLSSTSALLMAPPPQTGPGLLGVYIYANFWAQTLFFSWCTSVSSHGSNGLRCFWQHLKYGILWFSHWKRKWDFCLILLISVVSKGGKWGITNKAAKSGEITTFLLQVLSPTSL